ncbi:hypothetical protein MexAM1_META1p3827 [Methylorubrum extorquens AM1]|uniref:Uncharacterized protein n=1 Tax=Methylorubrum extorquens (strain ATCC 14718 / DSM 1338 / JCM 2805 / NCIMB 9133 / AM1) TaxID=272630 RepID=C5AZZ7_METEA|nr:hypothetical protein MexAM1_META1p3827 [Methylorubrum extorquens AM1]
MLGEAMDDVIVHIRGSASTQDSGVHRRSRITPSVGMAEAKSRSRRYRAVNHPTALQPRSYCVFAGWNSRQAQLAAVIDRLLV